MFRQRINCYLIERTKRENELQAVDKSRWYAVNRKCLPPELLATFYGQAYDEGTERFIAECYRKSSSLVTSFLIAIARSFLKLFMSATSVCGFLNCGSMFVFSETQFRSLVVEGLLEHQANRPRSGKPKPSGNVGGPSSANHGTFECTGRPSSTVNCHLQPQSFTSGSSLPNCKLASIDPNGPPFGALLDLGAGDGNVTSVMAPYFCVTYATEVSRFMQSRLQKRGFRLMDPFKWARETESEEADRLVSNGRHSPNGQAAEDCQVHSERKFDLISLLNVLDRCDRPLQMLADIHRKLRQSDGLLLLALVFPLCQYVEYTPDHQPTERLAVEGGPFEHQVASFSRDVLRPAGFEVVRWCKLPYLCEGNVDLTYFWLIDAVFLLRTVDKREV